MGLVSNDNGFNGYRFFLDAAGARQYAIKYENGTASKDIQVFDETGAKSSFRAGETVFAFEDAAQLTTAPGGAGALAIKPLAVQIRVSPDGKPVHFKSLNIEYDANFSLGPDASPQPSYKMTAASARLLQEKGFDANFPKELKALPPGNEFDQQITSSGLILLGSQQPFGLSPMPFPPQHAKGAEAARKATSAAADDSAGAAFDMPDRQTLVERKKLGGGETLRIIFNFEAERVTEIFTAPGTQPAATGHAFSEHDPAAIEAARKRLSDMGGKLKPSLKPAPAIAR